MSHPTEQRQTYTTDAAVPRPAPVQHEASNEAPSAADERAQLLALGFPAPTKRRRRAERLRSRLSDDAGAVTAEYALIIMAGVAFAGVLILIMRSDEVRSMLVSLVQNALQSAG